MSGASSDDVTKFMNITGGDDKQARHMLDACNGDVNAAVRLFYESQGSPAPGGAPAAAPAAQAPPPASFVKKEDDKPEERFVGGGQNVIYRDDTQPQNLLDAARALGAVSPEEDRKRQEHKFSGLGRRLGNGADVPPSAISGGAPRKEAQVKITMWKNGFSVDDGPLRDASVPADKVFIDDIKKGKIPKEILEKVREADGSYPEVVFTLEDKQEAAYEPPKKQFKAFSGEGRSLGSSSSSAPVSAPAPATSSGTRTPLIVDELKPTTTIQLTLPDGTRMAAKFNLDHTVGDVAGFVYHTQPNHPPFTMLTTFPRQELTNMGQTIKEAGLSRAVIMVKLQ
eukprot:TRINITY_DN3285_c0_g1_i1.p1 TRINITY_DN3285_c0_g1~~TRINITY_DN3285_c0_g1_i1.p1  ORF type:complete len:339 (+),score=72.43 TRINITY_DN3285_c0_g1_i1:43-1059(+)